MAGGFVKVSSPLLQVSTAFPVLITKVSSSLAPPFDSSLLLTCLRLSHRPDDPGQVYYYYSSPKACAVGSTPGSLLSIYPPPTIYPPVRLARPSYDYHCDCTGTSSALICRSGHRLVHRSACPCACTSIYTSRYILASCITPTPHLRLLLQLHIRSCNCAKH